MGAREPVESYVRRGRERVNTEHLHDRDRRKRFVKRPKDGIIGCDAAKMPFNPAGHPAPAPEKIDDSENSPREMDLKRGAHSN